MRLVKELKAGTSEALSFASLAKDHSPFVLGDSILNRPLLELPSIHHSISWSSLYPLTAMLMANEQPSSCNIKFGDLQSTRLTMKGRVDELLRKAIQEKIDWFHIFLLDWKLAGKESWQFNTRTNLRRPTSSDQNRRRGDRKILGYHRFTSESEVAEYVTTWLENPEVRSSELGRHRLILGRSIDLIASEVLNNAFVHQGSGKMPVMMLAKLCSHESARHALELHNATGNQQYLTKHELRYFEHSVKTQSDVLQVCIADCGRGFHGNQDLLGEYLKHFKSKPSTHPPSTVDLIRFALTGNYTTKTSENIASFYEEENPHLTVHGLSEVKRTIEQFGGYWRIHSGSDALDVLSNGEEVPAEGIAKVPGCLHYFMIPLVPLRKPLYSRPRKEPNRGQAAQEQQSNRDAQQIIYLPPDRLKCEKVLSELGAAKSHKRIIYLDLNGLDDLDAREHQLVCYRMIHTMALCRRSCHCVLVDASDLSKSYLTKHHNISKEDELIFVEVLAFQLLLFWDRRTTTLSVRSHIGNHRAALCEKLADLLQDDQPELLESTNPEELELFEGISKHNPCLFSLHQRISEDGITLTAWLSRHQSIICKNLPDMTWDEMAQHLSKHRAILPHNENGYIRLGKKCPTYVHLSKLWSDQRLRMRILDWAALEIKSTITKTPQLAVISILHPAIDLGRALLREPWAAALEFVMLSRRSDVRWDNSALYSLQATHAVLIVDATLSGELLDETVAALKTLGIETTRCLCMLAIGTHNKQYPLICFSRCTETERDALAISAAEASKTRARDYIQQVVIDADSQFTAITAFCDELTNINRDTSNTVITVVSSKDQKEHNLSRWRSLVDEGSLRFHHWKFGGQHSTYAILLRSLAVDSISLICREIAQSSQTHFGSAPDIMLVPGDSTAVDLAHHVADSLGIRDKLAFVNKAFQVHGDWELKLELADESVKPSKILFFDDGRSTQKTEGKAIRAVQSRFPKAKLEWLSFVVIDRGVRLPRLTDRTPPASQYIDVRYKSESYSCIGALPYHYGNCPMCEAYSRVYTALQGNRATRPSIRGLLKTSLTMLEPRFVEYHVAKEVGFDQQIGYEILLLLNTALIEACLWIRESAQSGRWSDMQSPKTFQETCAALFYIGLNFGDVCSYLSWQEIRGVVKLAIQSFDAASIEKFDAILAALALLPTSMLETCMPQIAETLLAADKASQLGAVAHLILTNKRSILQARAHKLHRSAMADWADKDSKSAVLKLIASYRSANAPADTIELCCADLGILECGVDGQTAPQVAKALALWLKDGRHASLLLNRLRQITSRDLSDVLSSLREVSSLVKALPPPLVHDLRGKLDQFDTQLDSIAKVCPSSQTVSDLGLQFVNDIWDEGICRYAFTGAMAIKREIGRQIARVLDPFYPKKEIRDIVSAKGITQDHFLLVNDTEAERFLVLKTRPEIVLIDHWENLLENVIKYFPSPEIDAIETGLPLVIIYVRCNVDYVDFVFADRGRAANDSDLWHGDGAGLRHTQARLEGIGGGLLYKSNDDGLREKDDFQPSPTQLEKLKYMVGNLDFFRNKFVTRFPIVCSQAL